METDFSPFRHLRDMQGSEPDGLFVDIQTGEPLLIRAHGDYWANPFALRFIPASELKNEGYQEYLEVFTPPPQNLATGERDAGAPGY